MKHQLALLFVAMAIGTSSAFANVPARDSSFSTEAAQTSMAEVKLGTLAQNRATRDDVKQFGRTLVKDHTEANKKLQAIASRKNLSLPTELSAEQKEHYADLEKSDRGEFDEAFIEHMIDGHKEAIKSFEQQAESGTDSELKKFAQNTLPTLKSHLETAERISDQM